MNKTSFIRETARKIVDGHSVEEIENSIFVFPNRRAGIFFKRELSMALMSKPFFVPDIFDINHFAESLSTLRKADEVELLIYLHKAYRDTYNDATEASLPLRSFIEMGLKLLHDFDEIDKYLVDAHQLFVNIHELSELTATMELSEEQKKAIQSFCKTMFENESKNENSLEFHRKYASLWNHITPIYDRFNAILSENKAAYEGKIFREVCESIPDEKLPQKTVYFIGFNILTASEEALIHRFEQMGRATLIFDYNKLQRTTAKFDYRHSINEFGFDIVKEGDEKKKYYDYPSMTSGEQVDNLHDILYALTHPSDDKDKIEEATRAVEQNTAVVLADESMLLQALQAVPDNIKHVNITMGYPLADTPIATFIAALIQYQVNIQSDTNGNQGIYHRHLMEVLMHPYSRIICDQEKIVKHVNKIRSYNLLRIHVSELKEIHPTLFQYADDIFAYVNKVTDTLDKHFSEGGNEGLDLDFIRQYRKRMTQLKNIIGRTGVVVNRAELTVLIRRITRNLKVQFKGEPLHGLQIMGLLECRLLDFDNVIFVGFNDQFVPGTGISDNTLIPYSLRKPYGLPSHEITNLIYSYNFYRMLHRCKTLHLIYNLATGDNSKNEVSRFHHQLKYLYGVSMEHVKGGQAELSGSTAPVTIDPYFPEVEPIKDYILSASSLKDYIKCPLKFYYAHILKIHEPKEIDETMQDSTFGKLLHTIMEFYYKSSTKPLDELCLQAYRKVCGRSYEAKGYDIIAFESAKSMAKEIIKYDKEKREPFTVQATEHEFKVPYKEISLKGTIDRIDNDNAETGFTWLIDYKTSGKSEKMNFEKMFDPAKAKEGDLENMQILFYCYAMQTGGQKQMKAQLYKVYAIAKDGELPAATVYQDVADKFEPLLKETLDKLMEALKKPQLFRQRTANEDNCKYCVFGNLCGK